MSLMKTTWLLSLVLSIANTVTAESLTLKEAEQLALENNPSLHAANSHALAMAAIPAQVGSLPDPTLSLNALNLPVNSFSTTQVDMTQMQMGISQRLPFPGKLRLQAEVAERFAKAAECDRDELRLLLQRNVRIHWWNLIYLDKALGLIQNNQRLLRHLVQVSEAKYKTGGGLQQDVLLAQLELSRLLEQEMSLTRERATQAASLNVLLGRDSVTPILLTQPLPAFVAPTIEIDSLKDWAKDHRPRLIALKRNIEAADYMVALSEREQFPDFKLAAAYGVRQGMNAVSGQRRSDLTSISLSMTLPIYHREKQDHAVDQRNAEQAEAAFIWQEGVNEVYAEIDAAASDLRISRDQLAMFDQGILPQARQTTASMLVGYQVNKVDFLNLVRAQLNELNMEIQYWKIYTLAHQSEARLEAAAGNALIIGNGEMR
ncbi:MAG: TolC family protein [Zetaproteobacteria bacterium]|nr:TolC family protein [Zetaproteobacteria bacterium]